MQLVPPRIYRAIKTIRGHTWYVPVNDPYPADDIWLENPFNKAGMCGYNKIFKLEDGSYAEVKGPWSASAMSLLKETGIDVTEYSKVSLTIKLASSQAIVYTAVDLQSSMDACVTKAHQYARTLGETVIAVIKTQRGEVHSRLDP